MQKMIGQATNEHLEVFTNTSGDRIVSRLVTRGTNNGIFGTPADGAEIAFSFLPPSESQRSDRIEADFRTAS